MLDLAVAALRPGATLIAVHWRHPVAGISRAAAMTSTTSWRHGRTGSRLAGHQEPDFIAEAYLAGRDQAVSVAAAEGLS